MSSVLSLTEEERIELCKLILEIYRDGAPSDATNDIEGYTDEQKKTARLSLVNTGALVKIDDTAKTRAVAYKITESGKQLLKSYKKIMP